MAREERQRKVCAYCGSAAPEARDHIPPKGMFGRPCPSDLLTVPCCERCRSGWSKDDEYFRTVVLSADNLQADPRTAKVTKSLLRSLVKLSKKGFSHLMGKSLTIVELLTKSGLLVGKRPGIKIDSNRVTRVLVRILRALFYREFGFPVPGDYTVDATFDQYGERILPMHKRPPFVPIRRTANNIFLWTYAKASDDPLATLWIGAFYGKVFFAGMVGPDHARGAD
jgi:hypothetical protein